MMPTRMKGEHAFRASNATTGAAHTVAAAAAAAAATNGPVGGSGGRVSRESTPSIGSPEPEEQAAVQLDQSDCNNPGRNNESASPVRRPPPSSAPSSNNSNKRKRSALDDMISDPSGNSEGGGGSSKRSSLRPSGPVALNAVAAQLGEFTSRFEKVMAPRPAARRTETSPERRMAAIKRLQDLETRNLDINRLVALVDLFKSSTDAAATYLSLDLDILRRSWLEKQLVELLGFPPLASLTAGSLSGEDMGQT